MLVFVWLYVCGGDGRSVSLHSSSNKYELLAHLHKLNAYDIYYMLSWTLNEAYDVAFVRTFLCMMLLIMMVITHAKAVLCSPIKYSSVLRCYIISIVVMCTSVYVICLQHLTYTHQTSYWNDIFDALYTAHSTSLKY